MRPGWPDGIDPLLRRQHHPGVRRPGRRLDPAPASAARPDASFPLGDTTFPAHATFNLGVSGDTSEGLLARLEREVQPRLLTGQTIVVLAVGVNETAFDLESRRPTHSVERYGEHLAELVATARRATDPVLLVGLLPCDETRMQPAPWSTDGESYGNDRIRRWL